MKRIITATVLAAAFWFATYAIVQMAVSRVMNGEHRRRVDALIAEMDVQVKHAQEINRIRMANTFWVADGDTMFLRGGEILDNPAVVGRPKRVSK